MLLIVVDWCCLGFIAVPSQPALNCLRVRRFGNGGAHLEAIHPSRSLSGIERVQQMSFFLLSDGTRSHSDLPCRIRPSCWPTATSLSGYSRQMPDGRLRPSRLSPPHPALAHPALRIL